MEAQTAQPLLALSEVLAVPAKNHAPLKFALEHLKRQSPLTTRELDAFRHLFKPRSSTSAIGSVTTAAYAARASRSACKLTPVLPAALKIAKRFAPL